MHTSNSLQRNFQRITGRFLVIATVLALSSLLFGQSYFGTVSGVLTDSTDAVVAGAKVILVDQQKGYSFATTSDNGGRYLFRSVPPGMYVVSVEAAGFGKTLSARFKVDINENATTNLTLKVAGASQTVQVDAQSQAIQTEDAETGQVVNRRFINDLPLIDRNVIALTSTWRPASPRWTISATPPAPARILFPTAAAASTADILTDGASVTNSEPNGGITQATYLPSPEAIEEFKVEQTNFSAEYGFSGASVVNMITRSGTNKFHGSAYDFVRDSVLDANNWFTNHSGSQSRRLRRNNYGFTIGGPIFKNKTFFFFRLRRACAPQRMSTLPGWSAHRSDARR